MGWETLQSNDGVYLIDWDGLHGSSGHAIVPER